jgi:hypothetical protein
VLKPYPSLVANIRKKFDDLRASGVPVNVILGHSIMITMIKDEELHLLNQFKCSKVRFMSCFVCSLYAYQYLQSYIAKFLSSVMQWSIRTGTHAARHTPENWEDMCKEATMRYLNVILHYDIPSYLCINMDQQGVVVVLGNNRTYAKKGLKQVDIAGKDEKRAYTLCIATSAAGDCLPFQQIWGGASKKSLPKPSPQQTSAESKGIHFTFAQSEKTCSHFSTLKTMKEVI